MNRSQQTFDAPVDVRVLHVDDDHAYRSLAAEFLERIGPFEVVSAASVEAGLDRLRADPIDCVVSDFDMPTADGLEFFDAVRDRDATVPFILLTGKGSEEVAADAISAGVTDYVQKRGGREQYQVLANRIENAVARSRVAEESRERMDRLRETFGRITDSFLSINDGWEVTYVNEQGASFLGRSVDELLGADLRDLPPTGAGRFHEEYAEALRTQEPVSFEAESLTQPGRWLDIRAYPTESGLSIYWRDITTLRRRERLLAELHRGSRDLLSCETTAAVATRTVTLAESLLGFDAVGLVGRGDASPEQRAILAGINRRDEPVVVEDTAGATTVGAERVDVDPGVYLRVGDDRLLFAQVTADGVDGFDVHCLQLLATTAETALARTRRERELERNRDVVRALHDSVAEFQDCETADAVLDVAIRSARDVISFDRCLFARHRDGALVRAAQSGDLPGTAHELPTSVGVSGRAFRTGESRVVDDARRADDVHEPCPFRSLLTVPLGDWGVFQVVAEEANAFDAADRELAELLGMHARVALARVQSDAALRRERDLLAAFFESSNEPVVRVRFDGATARIDHLNEAFGRVFGVDADAVRNEPLDDHIVPPAERETARALNEASHGGEPVEAEVRRLTVDGSREFLFRSAPFRGDDDAPMAYGIYVDITARKRRERELERYRTIVESTGDPVYTLDADGVITYVNEALESMTGYDTETLVGEHMRILVPAEGVARSEQLIRDLLRDDERTNDTVEIDLVRADGSRVRCENHIALLPFDEEFTGTAGAVRDITARKQRKRELEAQNERLAEFASVVSHDLRNPLQVAQGHLDLARDRLDDEDESLERVHGALDRIDAIVDDVLTLAREGETAPEPTEASVADVARLAWESVDTAGGRLVVEGEPTVRADEARLQRLFENLFRNSVEHGSTSSQNRSRFDDSVEHGSADGVVTAADPTDGQPTVTVRVGHVEGMNGATLFVEDDGPGIPPAARERVFETGYSTSDDGTGFGLDIVSTIAAAHGWEVVLAEGERGGARFEFHLPAGSSPA